ncbi:MAG: domain S-box protein [Acidobacteriota bacterium]|nr:domain S-box protein [Acidobacteriota bacterium]
MDNNQRIHLLEEKIGYLDKEKRAVLEGFDFAANLGNFENSLNKIDDPQIILELTHDRIRQVLNFKIISFYLVNEEDSNFYQAFTEPAGGAEKITREVDALIDDKTFAWARRRNKPVIVTSIDKTEKIVLHSLNTPSRTRGIFVGILASPEEDITDLALFLFSITIITCSNALESFELYHNIKNKNKELERNITMLEESSNRLKEEEEKYRALFEQSTNSIILYDPETRLPVQFNQLAYDNLGYTAEEFRNLKMEDYSLSLMTEMKDKIRYTIEKGQYSFETCHRRKNGEIRDIVVNARTINIRGKNYLLTLLNDVTEKKRAEEERLVLEKQLYQFHKMESLSTLAGGIAHDFNNILGVILGYSELSLTELPEEPTNPLRENIENLVKAVGRAKKLVQQILTFSHQGEEQQKPLNVNDLAKQTLEILRSTLPVNIELRQNIGEETNMVLGTPTQIQQVIMNLCTNALQSMGKNPGILTLEVHTTSVGTEPINGDFVAFKTMKPGKYVQLTIRDNGHGIAPNILERVFDPYFTTQMPGQGSGLGLAVVHGIVKNYNGNIAIDSHPGQGTVVKVWLPTIESPEAPEKDAETMPLGTERILLVDDEVELLKIHHKMLEQLRYKVVSVSNSTIALALFRDTPADFDIIITDMSMPNLTGDQLAAEALNIRPDIPIILCTGFSEFIDAKQAKAIGIKKFLMKPVNKKNLAVVVRNALDDKWVELTG